MNKTTKIVLGITGVALAVGAVWAIVESIKKTTPDTQDRKVSSSPSSIAAKLKNIDMSAFNKRATSGGRTVAASGLQDLGVAPEEHTRKQGVTAISVGAPLVFTGY